MIIILCQFYWLSLYFVAVSWKMPEKVLFSFMFYKKKLLINLHNAFIETPGLRKMAIIKLYDILHLPDK